MAVMRNVYNFFFATDHLEDLCMIRRIILESILGKQRQKVGIGFIWLRTGSDDTLF
jgi:hypothetical protein